MGQSLKTKATFMMSMINGLLFLIFNLVTPFPKSQFLILENKTM